MIGIFEKGRETNMRKSSRWLCGEEEREMSLSLGVGGDDDAENAKIFLSRCA